MFLLTLAHWGCPGQNPQSHKRLCMCVCVIIAVFNYYLQSLLHQFVILLCCCHCHCNTTAVIKYLTRFFYKSRHFTSIYYKQVSIALLTPSLHPQQSDLFNDVTSFHFQNFGLEYERYLKEIVSALETDEAFRKKLEESNISDIKVTLCQMHMQKHIPATNSVFVRGDAVFLISGC